jgi:hypothetical protein
MVRQLRVKDIIDALADLDPELPVVRPGRSRDQDSYYAVLGADPIRLRAYRNHREGDYVEDSTTTENTILCVRLE